MDIDKMPAGREMDVLVAELMGWKLMRWTSYPEYEPVIIGETDSIPPGGRIPDYSTDIAAAWELVDRLRASGTWCCVELLSDHDICWTMRLTRFDPHARGNHEPEIVCEAESICLAICRAALKATLGET